MKTNIVIDISLLIPYLASGFRVMSQNAVAKQIAGFFKM